nr:MAG TPA_asm: hypothetical protein [Caudoviricetes sp.]
MSKVSVIILTGNLLLIVGINFGIYGIIRVIFLGVMIRLMEKELILKKTVLFKLWRTKE